MKAVSRLTAVVFALVVMGAALSGCANNTVATVNGQAITKQELLSLIHI